MCLLVNPFFGSSELVKDSLENVQIILQQISRVTGSGLTPHEEFTSPN